MRCLIVNKLNINFAVVLLLGRLLPIKSQLSNYIPPVTRILRLPEKYNSTIRHMVHFHNLIAPEYVRTPLLG